MQVLELPEEVPQVEESVEFSDENLVGHKVFLCVCVIGDDNNNYYTKLCAATRTSSY